MAYTRIDITTPRYGIGISDRGWVTKNARRSPSNSPINSVINSCGLFSFSFLSRKFWNLSKAFSVAWDDNKNINANIITIATLEIALPTPPNGSFTSSVFSTVRTNSPNPAPTNVHSMVKIFLNILLSFLIILPPYPSMASSIISSASSAVFS